MIAYGSSRFRVIAGRYEVFMTLFFGAKTQVVSSLLTIRNGILHDPLLTASHNCQLCTWHIEPKLLISAAMV